ncbi:ABC-type cobalt transport system, permease component [Pyrodictium delaneyi]|uniref:ABC-type cobalt transport system, permease component n=1 Tax=Pyrodictium delaneyi TaxID=1273541 RepID=A0A0P0N4B1_9CREN|nr:energy-coupling factor transporter transmembrane component T [Pyrodictium delaneyi]ALL01527.1 ABC-type cobalt transport system, permease component [Pyrodictium delaneyi]OWJ54570.1 hypothetical protein Pdsh_05945 [Pyrodictium delaneyi]
MTRGLDRAVEGLLEGLRDATTTLAMGEGVVYPHRPELVFLTLVAGVTLVSSTDSIFPALAGLAGSIAPLVYILSVHRGRGRWLVVQPLVYAIVASFIISLPLILGGSHSEAVSFILRITASAAMVMSVARLVGWRSLAEGMQRLGVPREFTGSMYLVLRYTPLLAAEVLRLLVARRARSLSGRGLREEWRLLATAVGELLTRSVQRALVLSMALEARNLSYNRPSLAGRGGISLSEALAYLPSMTVIAALGLSLVAGH